MSFTPLLPPAKPAAGPSTSQGLWRPWSIPACQLTLSRSLCGLLNKLTWTNFDAIAHRIAQLARRVELSEDHEALVTLVRAVFSRGASEEARQEIYALLCQRIIDILEAERSRWRRVDVYHVGNPLRSFETVIRLLVVDEFRRARATAAEGELERLMRFMGVLLVHGVLVGGDVHDTLATLFDGAVLSDERCAVAICRFLSPVALAFNALPILGTLQSKAAIEDVLSKGNLTHKVRYLMMGILDQVSYPKPLDAFGSARRRTEAYGIDLDDDEYEEVEGSDAGREESEVDDSEWVRRDCEGWAQSFLRTNDYQHLINILHSLKPEHRQHLVCCLLSHTLYAEDTSVAMHVGSLYTARRLFDLCQDGELFIQALKEELSMLADVLLDVPNACQLMAHILRATCIPTHALEELVLSAIQDSEIAQSLLRELEPADSSYSSPRIESKSAEGDRLNRFERSSSCSSSVAAK